MHSQDVLQGRYEVRSLLGSGGMARVYLAVDQLLGREVAVKILRPENSADPNFVERFRREARAAASLNHPNIVTVYDWGSGEFHNHTAYFMVMEYIPGPNLKELIGERGPLPEIEALDLASQIAAALQAAHVRGIVHRDVKPHNVLIDPLGRAKVTDFGIAQAAGQSRLTATNVVTGSAHYLSPEQATQQEVDARSDLYSLGVVLFEMLTGKELFSGHSLLDVALQHAHAEPPSPRSIRPGLALETEAIVMKALAKKPADRYATAGEMRLALDAAREHLVHPDVQTPPDPDRTGQFARKRAPEAGIPSASTVVSHERRSRASRWLVAAPLFLLLAITGGILFATGHLPTGNRGAPELASNRPTATSTARKVLAATKPAGHSRTTATPVIHPTQPAHSAGETHHAVSPATGNATPRSHSTARPTQVPAVALLPEPTPTPVPPAPTVTSTPALPPASEAGIDTSHSSAGEPVQTVDEFYSLVEQGRYAEAQSLWSSTMQNNYPPADNIAGHFSSVHQLRWRVTGSQISPDGGSATVDVTVWEVFTGGSSRVVNLTWQLVLGSSGWLMNNP